MRLLLLHATRDHGDEGAKPDMFSDDTDISVWMCMASSLTCAAVEEYERLRGLVLAHGVSNMLFAVACCSSCSL